MRVVVLAAATAPPLEVCPLHPLPWCALPTHWVLVAPTHAHGLLGSSNNHDSDSKCRQRAPVSRLELGRALGQ